MVTTKQVQEAFDGLQEIESFEENYGNFCEDILHEYKEHLTKKLGKFKCILFGKDDDDNYCCVINIGNQYFRMVGNYDSWAGEEWDDIWEEVVPTEKRVIKTIWNKK